MLRHPCPLPGTKPAALIYGMSPSAGPQMATAHPWSLRPAWVGRFCLLAQTRPSGVLVRSPRADVGSAPAAPQMQTRRCLPHLSPGGPLPNRGEHAGSGSWELQSHQCARGPSPGLAGQVKASRLPGSTPVLLQQAREGRGSLACWGSPLISGSWPRPSSHETISLSSPGFW